MHLRHRIRKTATLDSIALTDIVMNLFLFFFITFNLFSTFRAVRESPIKVNLPTLAKGPVVSHIAAHEIFLEKTGGILWDQSKVTEHELKEKLKSEDAHTKSVSLRADRDASVQGLVSILEMVRDAGVTNASLQTKIVDSKTPS